MVLQHFSVRMSIDNSRTVRPSVFTRMIIFLIISNYINTAYEREKNAVYLPLW